MARRHLSSHRNSEAQSGKKRSRRHIKEKIVRTLARLAKVFAALVVFCVVVGGAYAAWSWWDVRQLRSFCQNVPAAAPLTSLDSIAAQYGINPAYVSRKGVFRDDIHQWTFFVPAISSVGDINCTIHHDGTSVISATMTYQ